MGDAALVGINQVCPSSLIDIIDNIGSYMLIDREELEYKAYVKQRKAKAAIKINPSHSFPSPQGL